MRLIAHNFLISNVRGTDKGYPLRIEASKVEYLESSVDFDFIKRMLPKIDYGVLIQAAQQISPFCNPSILTSQLPLEKQYIQTANEGGFGCSLGGSEYDSEILKQLHHLLLDYHVIEGYLVCPDTGRKFTILQGIPNMILHEDEI